MSVIEFYIGVNVVALMTAFIPFFMIVGICVVYDNNKKPSDYAWHYLVWIVMPLPYAFSFIMLRAIDLISIKTNKPQ